MRSWLLVFGIAVAVTAVAPQAQAQNYPWCALYGGSGMGGGRNCGFTTYEQCMATISGIGGSCMQNTMYEPPAPASRKRSRHTQY